MTKQVTVVLMFETPMSDTFDDVARIVSAVVTAARAEVDGIDAVSVEIDSGDE